MTFQERIHGGCTNRLVDLSLLFAAAG